MIRLYVGLPKANPGALSRAAAEVDAPVMLSAGGLWDGRRGGFQPIALTPWRHDPGSGLDSSGFVALARHGGYRWGLSEYVEQFLVGCGPQPRDTDEPIRSAMPSPFDFVSQMDYCAEPEIAADRAEVLRRVALTVDAWRDTVDLVRYWRDYEGVPEVRDAMPVLQGRLPEDYLRCAEGIASACDGGELPALVGIGSVCRREVDGPDGVLAVVGALDDALPPGVRLHLFGVKGDALGQLRGCARVASADSMAWDTAARWCEGKMRRGAPCEVDGDFAPSGSWPRGGDTLHRAAHLTAWYLAQSARLGG